MKWKYSYQDSYVNFYVLAHQIRSNGRANNYLNIEHKQYFEISDTSCDENICAFHW